MAHIVKCKVCGNQFDRDKVACLKVSANRYAHKHCAEKAGLKGEEVELPHKDPDLTDLENYIMKLFGEDYVNVRIRKQIKDYQDQYGYTYSGMLKTLIYFFEIKGNSVEKANGGIGIIPYVYKDACQYYYALYLAKMANEEKNIEDYKPKPRIIEIFAPVIVPKKIRLFSLGEEDDE